MDSQVSWHSCQLMYTFALNWYSTHYQGSVARGVVPFHVSFVICIICCLLYIICYFSCITCPLSCIIYSLSCIICGMYHLLPFMYHFWEPMEWLLCHKPGLLASELDTISCCLLSHLARCTVLEPTGEEKVHVKNPRLHALWWPARVGFWPIQTILPGKL